MTYNVGVFDKYKEDSTEDISELVRALDIDVVALNELDSCNRRHNVYQLKEFAEALGGWYYAFSSSFQFAGGAYGNGIVSDDAMLDVEKVLLPMSDGYEQRCMIVVETEKYVLACTHLDHKGQSARRDQLGFIDRWLSERYERVRKPVFLCGDMNSAPEDQAIQELKKKWALLSVIEPTYPSYAPRECIDYIFCLNPKYIKRVVQSQVISSSEVAKYSDHLPVILKIEIK